MTKEELGKLLRRTRHILHRFVLEQVMRGSSRKSCDAEDDLNKLQAEFEKYIDVLEPLRDQYLYPIVKFMERVEDSFPTPLNCSSDPYFTEWEIVQKIIKKATALINKEKEKWKSISYLETKHGYKINLIYCPSCGAPLTEVER